ncbi:MAG: hypothetical protein H0W89_00700 [Candidatus Levybacteria bacterium]|nr:hypothetical protein [Candidatus Levybacteria bacterium]
MNAAFKQLRADKIIRLGMTISLALILLHAVYLAFFYLSLPPVLPLYNQMPWGESRLGSRLEILIPLATTIIFFFINYILLAKLYSTMPLVSRMISVTTLLLSLVSIIFIVRTLQLIL